MRITHIGGPTVLVELHGWRILVDPTFDPPGRRYTFGFGTSSRKLSPPAVAASDLGRIDLILVSHDHHADNLDDAGRRLLDVAAVVLTTRAGSARLGLRQADGLRAGESVVVELDGRAPLEVTATPCRHGPPLSRAIVGEVVGFALREPGAKRFDLWLTGDSVLFRGIRRVARAMDVDVVVVNAGGVRFGLTGPITYSMGGRDAVRLVQELDPRIAVPAHYEGWSHFRDGPEGIRRAVADAASDVRARFRWLAPGEPTPL